MINQSGRLHAVALGLSPALVVRWHNWQARRARDRQRAQAQIARLTAIASGIIEPPPEPREHINTIWSRVNTRRQPWQDYNPDLSTWDDYVRECRGGTRAADNLVRRFR